MQRFIGIVIGGVIGLVVLSWLLVTLPPGQDVLLPRMVDSVMRARAADTRFARPEIAAYICGSSSPLPAPGRAQGCVAIVTPEHFFIVDAGAGSAANLMQDGLPLGRLQGVLVTHFHSDHIAAIPDISLNSWVQARTGPLLVYGGPGVERVVNGLNEAYALDRGYRTAHHGADFLPTDAGRLAAETIAPGVIFDDGSLRITAFTASHPPIEPALSFRFDYGGRTIIVTGDTNVTAELTAQVEGIDLLLTDALSVDIVTAMRDGAERAGMTRNAHILNDILDYHAHTDALTAMIEATGVRMTGLYHLVPAPQNLLFENVFKRGLPDNVLLTDDGMLLRLPVASDAIHID